MPVKVAVKNRMAVNRVLAFFRIMKFRNFHTFLLHFDHYNDDVFFEVLATKKIEDLKG